MKLPFEVRVVIEPILQEAMLSLKGGHLPKVIQLISGGAKAGTQSSLALKSTFLVIITSSPIYCMLFLHSANSSFQSFAYCVSIDSWTPGWRWPCQLSSEGTHSSIIMTSEGHYKEFYGYPIRTKFFIELFGDEMAYPDKLSCLSHSSITGGVGGRIQDSAIYGSLPHPLCL